MFRPVTVHHATCQSEFALTAYVNFFCSLVKIQIYAEKLFIEMETHEGTYCVNFSNRGPFGLRETKHAC